MQATGAWGLGFKEEKSLLSLRILIMCSINVIDLNLDFFFQILKDEGGKGGGGKGLVSQYISVIYWNVVIS